MTSARQASTDEQPSPPRVRIVHLPAQPGVQTVRASIRPDNTASYDLASQYGFTEVGEQWDEVDGLEIIYEVDAGRYPSSHSS